MNGIAIASSILLLALAAAAFLFMLSVYVSCRRLCHGRRMPVMPLWRGEWFEVYEPERIVWKVPPTETQSECEYPCDAYSLAALMKSPPLSLKYPPTVEKLINKLLFKDWSGLDYLERNRLIGKTNFVVRFLRKLGFCSSLFRFENTSQIKDYVKQFSPAIVTIARPFETVVSEEKVLIKVSGWSPVFHSVLIYGVDENFVCPDGSRGAFRVRWHLDWNGNDGWIPFNLAEEMFLPKCSFGHRF